MENRFFRILRLNKNCKILIIEAIRLSPTTKKDHEYGNTGQAHELHMGSHTIFDGWIE